MRIGPQSVSRLPTSQVTLVGRGQSPLDVFGSVFGDSTSQPLAISRFVPIVREPLLLTVASQRSPSALAAESDPRPRLEALIESIRQAAANPLLGDEGIEGQQAEVDAALLEIGKLTGAEIRLGGPPGATISDFDASRIDSIDVLALTPSGKLTITGTVTQAAEAARIEIAGTTGMAFDSKTSLVITGEGGIGTFNIGGGESFAEVADRISNGGRRDRRASSRGRQRIGDREPRPRIDRHVASGASATGGAGSAEHSKALAASTLRKYNGSMSFHSRSCRPRQSVAA